MRPTGRQVCQVPSRHACMGLVQTQLPCWLLRLQLTLRLGAEADMRLHPLQHLLPQTWKPGRPSRKLTEGSLVLLDGAGAALLLLLLLLACCTPARLQSAI